MIVQVRRRGKTLIAVGLAVVLVLAGIAVIGNDYRLQRHDLTIRLGDQRLNAVLTTPETSRARGLVVMVHGDGPIDATHGGLYLPWFEAAADAGYATLSWDKPGVGESSGNWLHQSMDDRAAQTSAVIDWATNQADVPSDRIVLWGASQAGWVLPNVAASRSDIDAVVAVSPAINWLRQGRYNLLAELDHEGADAAERSAAIGCSNRTRALLKHHADYATYKAQTCDPEPMTPDRWRFVSLNVASDATADLASMSAQAVPVLLLLAQHDRNVDIVDTEVTYRRLIGPDLSVEYFDATHSMARPIVEDCQVIGLVTGTLWPRALMAAGVLDSYRAYLDALP